MSMRRQFITTLVLLLRSIISIGAANKCTDGSAVKDLIGFTLDGERALQHKAGGCAMAADSRASGEPGACSLVGIADCGRLRGLRATRDIEAGETLLSMRGGGLSSTSRTRIPPDVAALWNASSLPGAPPRLFEARSARSSRIARRRRGRWLHLLH